MRMTNGRRPPAGLFVGLRHSVARYGFTLRDNRNAGRQGVSRAHGSVVAVLVAIATVVFACPTSAATPAVTVTIDEGPLGCASGTAPANTTVTVTIKTPAGDLREREREETGALGIWISCVYEASINAHDRVIVEWAGHKTVFRVPLLTVSIDRSKGLVGGRAPAGAAIDVVTSRTRQYTRVRADNNGFWRLPGHRALQSL